MSSRFIVPDSSPGGSSPAPSTPEKRPGHFSFSSMGDAPSTTPAGPPPSSAASFTPIGAPTDSFLGSSMMRGNPGSRQPSSFGGQGRSSHSPARKLFAGATPQKPSARGRERQPSGLSRQFIVDDEDEDEDEDAEGEEYAENAVADEYDDDEDAEGDEYDAPSESLLRLSKMRTGQAERRQGQDDADAEIARFLDNELADEDEDEDERSGEEYDESEEDEDEDADADAESDEESENADLFLNMRNDDRGYGQPMLEEDPDLLMLNTPAATDRVRREAESLFRPSASVSSRNPGRGEFRFAAVARDITSRHEPAQIAEPAQFIVKTEQLVSRLYDDGVGPEDDVEKLSTSLSTVTARLADLWEDRCDQLPPAEGEDLATIGPGEDATPFEKAAFIGRLILSMHHMRFDNAMDTEKTPPLPETLFDWLESSHNMYPDQVREMSRYKPSPACHVMFWQVLRITLLRGNVGSASWLLKNAGWEHVRKGPRGERAYTGEALEAVKKFAASTCEILDQCPSIRSDWDIWNSAWTLFRVQARGALNRLTIFAEGKSSNVSESGEPQSISAMARKASSQIPWDVYENLQTVYGIILGDMTAIMETAQDWCEATVGLMAWWDDGRQSSKSLKLSQIHGLAGQSGDYFERLAAVFHMVIDAGLNPNTMNPVEVALASAFEGNVNAVIGFIRMWSLPVACSVAEVASLGEWLPPPDDTNAFPADGLDLDDLELLGVSQPNMGDVGGIKDATLVLYARSLAGIDQLSLETNGWEMAIQVLGRMDLPEKSEDTVGELLRDLLATLDEHSSQTVDKIWRILNDLGMINFAEETAEAFGDILSKESHRYGEALWYFALAHRTDKVRDVLNLLMSYSLIQSTAYPMDKELDDDLREMLENRSQSLERRAKQDIEAAQLLGRLLSGYATLRKFYDLRDGKDKQDLCPSQALVRKRQAASALSAVISSSGDNIRGGLYDECRDAVVSEDFLLVLLAEATVFVRQSPSIITLEQLHGLLKAIDDLQTVGSRVYTACEDFFGLVLSSGQGLKGSTPADMLKKSTSSLSGSSYVMSGSSMLASHLHRAIGASGNIQRGWDWRKNWTASTKGEDVLRKLRSALCKDLASLWLEEADGVDVLF